MKPGHERRREPRVQVLNLVSVDQQDESGELTELAVGRTLDLSRLGMRLELTHRLPLRSRVRLTIAMAERIITVHGQVRYVNEIDEVTCSMGIEFVDLEPEDGDRIEEFLNAAT